MGRLPISLCLIVKNEGLFLKKALERAAPFCEELIVFDSGSTDQTMEIAKSFEKEVSRFVLKTLEWKDDFSAARNQVALEATSDWILFLDGDEILEANAEAVLRKAIQNSSQIACYSLLQRNYTYDPKIEEVETVKTPLPGLDEKFLAEPLYYFENYMERFYLRTAGLQYEGCIHESLLPSCERKNLKHERLPLILHHYGRLKPEAQNPQKAQYYLKLTEKKWSENQNNPAAWMELAFNLMELGDFARAFEKILQATQRFKNEPEILKVGFQAALRSDQFPAAEKWILDYLKFRPEDPYAKSQLTTAFLYQRKFDEVLKLSEENLFQLPEDFVSAFNAGVVYFEREDWPNALRYLSKALSLRPKDEFVRSALHRVELALQKS